VLSSVGYAKHILTYPYGDPAFGSCVSGDTELAHVTCLTYMHRWLYPQPRLLTFIIWDAYLVQ